ncbi:uncharacterized protein LOC135958255 [Calliphora vicina]|uniref:uncharacterized protein LOC135958255 n=1 Tax=Calliphora vicina TaxID=7373 RepID=UPI00325AE3C6
MFLTYDDMVECPYNKTHIMLRKRLQSHLLKCRVNYPDVELRKCPFNITHLIPEPEYTHHATNCPDRKLITQYKYEAPEPKEDEGPKHAPIECDEDWDDTDVNDYNPKLNLENSNIIRKPDGANPSERKLFIKKERKRLGDGDESSDDEKNKAKSYWETEAEKIRRKDNTSPSTSSYSKGRSRSPVNKSKRDRSRSPLGFRRSHRDHSPPRRSSIDHSRNNSPPSSSGGRSSYSYKPDIDPYYNGGASSANNNQSYSGRDPYFSNGDNSQAYYDRNTATNPIMPQAPPPPMISYPAPRSYLTTKAPARKSD